MASRAADAFVRPDGALDRAETGQPWVAHRGSGNIKSGRAFFAGSNPGSIYTVDTGIGGGDATINMDILPNDGGGQALYFRLVDVNRWWRVVKRYYTYSYSYQYQSGTTPETYGWVGNGTYRYEPAGEFQYRGTAPSDGRPAGSHYASFDPRVGVYLSYTYIYRHADGRMVQDHYYVRSVYENQSYVKTGGGEPIYSWATGTNTTIELRLEKCVNGQVSLVNSTGIADDVANIGVQANGDNITVYSNKGTHFNLVDGTHSTATRHGIGYAETSEQGNQHGIESFSAVPFVISGYMPPLML